MNKTVYMDFVKTKLGHQAELKADSENNLVYYQEVFEWKWFATKLKIFTHVTHRPEVSGEELKRYSSEWLQYSLKNARGLPRGLNNGVVSLNVIIAEQVSPEAIAFAQTRPPKHYSAFEMPIVYDLSSGEVYYYRDKTVWGVMYTKYIESYIQQNLTAPHNKVEI